MPLLADSLSVWTIAFRWTGRDPRWPWPFIPLEVEDHLRNLMDAILSANLACETITLEKRDFSPDERQFSVYYWLDDIYACMHGQRFNRKLLRWAHIERYDFELWCKRMNIPLPEFWFPPDWNLEYELPEGEIRPGHGYIRRDWSSEEWEAWKIEQADEGSEAQLDEICAGGTEAASISSVLDRDGDNSDGGPMTDQAAEKLRSSQACRIACQQIAKVLWKDDPDRTIASVIADELIQKYGGGNYYVDDTIREWVKVVAPTHVRDRRGRPRKNRDERE